MSNTHPSSRKRNKTARQRKSNKERSWTSRSIDRQAFAYLSWDSLDESTLEDLRRVGIEDCATYVEVVGCVRPPVGTGLMAWLADCGLGRTVPGQPIEAIVAQHYASLKLAVKFTELINGQNQLLADALAVGAIPSADLLVDVFPLPSGGFYVFAPFPMDSPEFRLWLDAVGRAKIKLANPIFRTFAPI